MKRDFDLIRSILLEIYEAPAGTRLMQLKCASAIDRDTLIEHLILLLQAELIDVEIISAAEGVFDIERLTWKGQDFVAAARSDTVWSQAKEKLLKVGGSASLEIVKAVLVQITKSQLGLS